jgi:diguanylate cyclase (GGDEF)-like protein
MNQALPSKAFRAGRSFFRNDDPDWLGLYEQAASLVPIGAFSCDLTNDRLSWTRGVFDIFGLPDDREPDREAVVEMYGEESRQLLERKRSHAIEARSSFSLDARISTADGNERWIRITAATKCSNGRSSVLYGMKQDITVDHARWELLRAQAECDPLTGVGNRALFQRFLDAPKSQSPLGAIGALVLFDMDGFKQINDWWGHAAGDACLAAFGGRLRRAFPQAQLISRIGGDEFAVLLAKAGSSLETEAAVRSVVGDLLSPVPWNGDLLPLGVSVGLAFASQQSDLDPQKLFLEADRALYNAKESASAVVVRA